MTAFTPEGSRSMPGQKEKECVERPMGFGTSLLPPLCSFTMVYALSCLAISSQSKLSRSKGAVLVSSVSPPHRLGPSGKRKPQLRKWLYLTGLWESLWDDKSDNWPGSDTFSASGAWAVVSLGLVSLHSFLCWVTVWSIQNVKASLWMNTLAL